MTVSKRILCGCLCLVLTLSLMLSVNAQEQTTDASFGDFSYKVLQDGTLCITEYSGEGGEVSVPSEIDGKAVSTLGDELFWYMDNVTSVSLPQGLEYIGARVFQGCTSIKKIDLPDSVAEIGDACFVGCSTLTQINIPAGLVYVGAFAFDDTPWITQFDGCSSVIFAGTVFYKYLDDDDKVVIPDGIVCISGNAFESKKLSFVKIPDSVAFIGDYCFYNCPNLKEIRLPSDLYYLGENSLGLLQGVGEVKPIEDFTIYAKEGSVGAEYAQQYGITLVESSEFTEPESLPEAQACVPTGEIKSTAEVQKSAGLSQGAAITVMLSVAGCVVVIGAVTLVSHFYEKKRKRDNKKTKKKKK